MTKREAPYELRAGLRITEAGLEALRLYELEHAAADTYKITPAGEAALAAAERITT